MRIVAFLAALVLTGVPVIALAQVFVPIAPIPDLPTTVDGNLTSYVNTIFSFAIMIGAIIAVFEIAYGGIEIMLSSAVPQQMDGKKRIRDALLGLALLLMVYLILNVINPQLVSLNALQ